MTLGGRAGPQLMERGLDFIPNAREAIEGFYIDVTRSHYVSKRTRGNKTRCQPRQGPASTEQSGIPATVVPAESAYEPATSRPDGPAPRAVAPK